MHIRERTGEGDESEETVGVEIAGPCGSYESFWILLQIHIEGLPAAPTMVLFTFLNIPLSACVGDA